MSGHVRADVGSSVDLRPNGAREPRTQHAGTHLACSEEAGQPVAMGALFARAASLLDGLAEVMGEIGILEDQLATSRETAVIGPSPNETGGEHLMPKPQLLSAKKVGERIGCDAATVRRWRREGKMPPAFANGSVVRWADNVIERWIETQTEEQA